MRDQREPKIQKQRGRTARILGVGALTLACNALDDPTSLEAQCEKCTDCIQCDGEKRTRRIVPLDERPAITASVRPPPISGGTLLVTRGGSVAVAADPDRDRVVLVDLNTFTPRGSIAFEPGDEPGRVVEGPNGMVHVALRGSGDVASIDTVRAAITARHAVCAEPRGLAMAPPSWTTSSSLLLVACAEGKLVELELGDGSVRFTALSPDLRDVVVQGTDVFVTRFRSAEMLKLNTQRQVTATLRPDTAELRVPTRSFVDDGTDLFEPGVAWRAIPTVEGVTMVHQRATTSVVDLDPSDDEDPMANAYGGLGNCSGIVQPAVTLFSNTGEKTSLHPAGTVLPVDVAVSATGADVAIAYAGTLDPEHQPQSVVVEFHGPGAAGPAGSLGAGTGVAGGPGSSGVSVHTLTESPADCSFPRNVPISEPVIAVAFDTSGRLYAQTREPSQLVRLEAPAYTESRRLSLGGASRLDTGHELFHRNGGAGIACASCHPEGAEDGRVWHFDTMGPRRTQALHVGLEGTAPFHWDGTLANIDALMTEVFIGRMGGSKHSRDRIESLTSYLFSFRPPAPLRAPDDAAARRGRSTFERAGCATCHSGPKLTNNATVSVGKLEALQVPSLIGLARRAPFLHDGCAATLEERFNPACGGADHGNLENHAPGELDDLIAYLETL